MMNNVKIKKFGHTCDVFFGEEGWEPWARFKLKPTRNGVFLTQIGGHPVPSPVFKHVIKEFNDGV